MARWRRAIEVATSDDEIATLTALSRSRTEPARRVVRAQMLLAYGQNPPFCAVGKKLGVHHQTVQRCIERAVAYGPLAALDDRPRPGKEPTITPQAKAWLVSLACDKAKDHGYPHELWTTRLLARHAREHGVASRARVFGQSGSGHGVQDPWQRGNQAAQGALLPGKSRRRVRTEHGRGAVRLSSSRDPEKGQVEAARQVGGHHLVR